MKRIKILLGFALILCLSIQCTTSDDGATSVETPLADNMDAILKVSNDNSGNVTITPTAEGAVSFEINYGDGSGSDASAIIKPGENTTHSYAEGDYTISVDAMNIAGEKSTTTYPLTVTYRAPENLNVAPVVNGYDFNITAEANYANGYTVYFGDMEGEAGTSFGVSESFPGTYLFRSWSL